MICKLGRLLAIAAMIMGFVGIGWAAETEVDPSSSQRRAQSDLSLRQRDREILRPVSTPIRLR